MPSEVGQELKRTVGPFGAVALALGIVIGAGMFSLPGLVYAESGGWAVLAWVLDGVLILPLLVIFSSLGRRFPGAGGVTEFISNAFPSLKPGCAYILIGAFALGLPAIALTGAGYIASFFGLDGRSDSAWIISGIAGGFLLPVTGLAWKGASLSGYVQNVVVTLLVVCLAVVAILAIPGWGSIDFSVGNPTWPGVWNGMALAIFAYTGWEMLACISEEFEHPERDFPMAVALSFAIVLLLYVGIALAVQAYVEPGNSSLVTAPFLAVIEAIIGDHALSRTLFTILTAVVISANLNGAVWAASRSIFDVGRDGWTPRWMALHVLESATPRRALLFLSVIFIVVLLLYAVEALSLTDLLRTAGQNFFVLYLIAVAAFLKLETAAHRKAFGAITLLICLVFGGVFGWGLLYSAVLFCLPYLVRRSS